MDSKAVKSLICEDFKILKNEAECYKIEDYIKETTGYPRYFLYKNGRAYLLLWDAEKKISFINVEIIEDITTIKNIIYKLSKSNLALVKEKSAIIGYITPSSVINTLFEEYEKQNQFIQTILQTSENSYTAIDQDSNVIYWSKGAEKLFGINRNTVIGNPISNFFEEENLEILDTLRNKSVVSRRQHQARDDLVVLVNSNPVIYRDETIGAVVSEEDITSQIRLNNELYKTSENLFSLEKEIKKSTNLSNPFGHIRGNSSSLKKTKNITEKVAKTDAAVLIYGESGVGKELFAKAIHNMRESEQSPYIAINCGAISSSLFESEIFGYEKGAFSGADSKGKKGKAELAKGGTLFLDEIGEMPLDMQVKFLRL